MPVRPTLLHRMALVSFLLFCKNLGNLREFFGQIVYRPTPLPPGQKIARTPMNIISLPDALNFYISPDTKVLSHFVPLLVSCRPKHLVNSCVLCSLVAQMVQLVSSSSLSLVLINHSPRSGGAASIECWRAIFSTSCYPHIVPMMNR